MAKMSKFMVTHITPDIPWEKVEENWAKLAHVETASWIRTCYNKEKGIRYCVWLAPDEDTLNSIFSELRHIPGTPWSKFRKLFRICGARNGKNIWKRKRVRARWVSK